MKTAGKVLEEKLNDLKKDNVETIIIDTEYEYENLAKKVGAKVINFDPSNASTINILDIIENNKKNKT